TAPTESLAGILEILMDYEDKIYCAANNNNEQGAYLYQVDAASLEFEEISYPGKRIVALAKNIEDQVVYAICEGSNIVIKVDHQNFTSNTVQIYSSDPKDICYNSYDNKIYIANYEHKQIDIYNTSFNLLESISVSGNPKKVEYNSYQNNIYVICDQGGSGYNYLSIISCTDQALVKEHEIRKSDGLIYDNINDQLYLHTNYPSSDNNYELNIKALDNFDDEFSNIIGTENYNYSDILLNKKRLVQSKPSINQKKNKIYVGNYAISSASIINAYEETFTYRPGWSWLSFPRLERYQDNIFDAITLLERIDPWPPDYLEMTYEPDEIDPKYIIYDIEAGWITTGELTEVKSSQGYKLLYEKNVPDFSIRLEGAKLDYDTEIDLVTGENWVGYFLNESYYPKQCLPADLWDDLEQIKTQYWTMTKMPSDPPYWFLSGKKTPFKYSDLVILKTSAEYNNFQWQIAGDGEEDTELPQTSYFTFEEQADYLPFYVETDSTSDIQEISVLADGEVKGAAVREPGDTLVEVNGYLEGVAPGAVIEFETWNGYKSRPVEKGGYVVIDHQRRVREKRNIYAGEKASYYHVSLKSNEIYNIPAEINLVSCKPNPFSQSMEFSFRLNRENDISLKIYDMRGNLVKTIINGKYPEGFYRFAWRGENDAGNRISPGVYFYKVSTGNGTLQTNKIVMIK
ncbi:MAG: T9SS type A sorting domain-containing protein, partial [Bacteroidales bacterium]|nr:T9SS type A sorting domain-containing protein [Bacteroidales bacterium]